MSRCELCGSDVESLTTVRVSSAKMDVCDNCTDHGTIDEDQEESTETTTKYDTSSDNSDTSSTSKSESNQTSTPSKTEYTDSTEEFTALPPNYGDIIQEAREKQGLSRKELASELNEKESLIRRIENNSTQPTKKLQQRLERKLSLDLSGSEVTEDFTSEGSTDGLTIGDILERD